MRAGSLWEAPHRDALQYRDYLFQDQQNLLALSQEN
jgi:hypothetical protein